MDFRSKNIINKPIQNIVFVCLLSLATLWLSGATAAHIHLDDHDIQCELCHSPNTGESSLQERSPTPQIISTVDPVVVDTSILPQLTTAAPLNSRAPPYSL